MFHAAFVKISEIVSRYLASHIDFLKKAFSDNGTPSSSRLLSIPHAVAAIFCLVYVTVKTHGLPDGLAITGLSGFATAPYAVNRVSNMFGGQKKDQDGVQVVQGQ
jgi:hypothetical protein